MGNTQAAPSQVLYVNNTEPVTFTAAIGNVTYAIGPDLAAEQARQAAKKQQKDMEKAQKKKAKQKQEEANKNAPPKKKSWGSSGFKLAKGMGSLAVKGAKLSASLFDDAPQIPLRLFEIQEAMENNNNTLLLRFPSVPGTATTNIKAPTLPGKHGKYNCGVCGGERCLKVKVVEDEGKEVTVDVGFFAEVTVKVEVKCTTCGRETKTRGPSSAPNEVWQCDNVTKTLDPYNGKEHSKKCSAILCMECCPNSVPVRYGMPVHLSANFNKGKNLLCRYEIKGAPEGHYAFTFKQKTTPDESTCALQLQPNDGQSKQWNQMALNMADLFYVTMDEGNSVMVFAGGEDGGIVLEARPFKDVPAGERAVFKASGRPSGSRKGKSESGTSSGKSDALVAGVGLGLFVASTLLK